MKTKNSPTNNGVAEVHLIYKSKVPASERKKISGSRDAFSILNESWNMETIEYFEEFKVLLLNRANKGLGIIKISQGGISGTVIDCRIIFQAALKANATSIILAHNHPSGNLKPSEADIAITKKIRDGGRLLDIQVLDHIILIPSNNYSSMADESIL